MSSPWLSLPCPSPRFMSLYEELKDRMREQAHKLSVEQIKDWSGSRLEPGTFSPTQVQSRPTELRPHSLRQRSNKPAALLKRT